ncbi:tyramine oxidase subunit B [Rhodobacter capsulatus]|jgi:ornithine cyclodeaminase|uniref:Ornithine cyclodeaminase n=1 Tax=Rhodobacter capsulatus (strain ATCC BAA-309 / NBRC 16581 / SB1003) TaxID=272942 RepID=D5ATB3_RHOCB|nr:tyramine oxidase subunit B [Rhodobacter capsulatus]ADE85220.1 ornithine cyclodeaminase [Rhodobacter capsulatus SB 1003]ETD01949.1 ornithine cyclodeaminase [Rhodobacter capsulatus DE442]ETD77368.1 ornithine cyclodeaminase [Rhodobacter capsulatus R121]ETE53949.1 ornithine cyclodeaminase [Rhodobacter capsulatus Y262]MDS0926930.1 tyramine oxidase subunit B [Rhodobacter capsulatus]
MNAETRIDFLYLSEPDMIKAGVTDMAACVDCMEEMFGLLHAGDYRMAGPNNDSHGAMVVFPAESPFPTMPKPTADRRFMAMPAYLGGRFCTTGMKWYGSNIANRQRGLPRSILMFTLNDTETGAPLAHMSANLLSAYRTGAVPGVGARHLARPDSKIVGILGPGVMAKTTLAAFMVACPKIDTLKVKGRGEKSLQNFLAWVAETYPQITSVTVVDSIEEVVRGSDLFSYCNSGETGDPSTYPIVKRDWVKPGAFMAMPAVCNIDEGMQAPDVRKVLDNTGLYEAWYEEVPKPAHATIPVIGVKFMDMIAEGKLSHDDLEDLGAIVAGEAPGRKNDQEIIIMSVGGMPVEDVAWGTVLYRNALERGIGVKLNLWDEPVLR